VTNFLVAKARKLSSIKYLLNAIVQNVMQSVKDVILRINLRTEREIQE